MIDLDPLVHEELDAATPVPTRTPDWDAVVAAAARRRRPARGTLVVAVVATALAATAALVTPLGAAVGHGIATGFGWLTGDEPGEPAPEAEDDVVSRDAMAWPPFPERPRVRSLLHLTRDGVRYDLFGFRTGGNVCLRLTVTGLRDGPILSCSPLAELRATSEPAIPLIVDDDIGADESKPPIPPAKYVKSKASVSFGLADASVTRVRLLREDGPLDAVVGNNAFLAVRPDPDLGARTRSAVAIDVHGRERPVPIAFVPFGDRGGPSGTGLHATGPTKVEAHIEHPRVAWVERHELRGEPLPKSGFTPFTTPESFIRVIQPDPHDFIRVLVGFGENARVPRLPGTPKGPGICHGLATKGGIGLGCAPPGRAFTVGPLDVTVSTIGAGAQTSFVSGLAADGVGRIDVFLGTGERQPVPLRDNAFFVRVPRAKFPARVVAYDELGRVVDVRTFATS